MDPDVPTASEQYWRGQFRAAKERIHTLEDELATDKRLTEEAGGFPITGRYHCANGFYAPAAGYGGSVVLGTNGARINVGPVVVPGYFNYGGCFATISPEYERARARIEQNSKALERAKEDLHDLERRASFEAVPNEWRR